METATFTHIHAVPETKLCDAMDLDLDLEDVMGFAATTAVGPVGTSTSSDLAGVLDGIDLLDPPWPSSGGGDNSFTFGSGLTPLADADGLIVDDLMLLSPDSALPPLPPSFQNVRRELHPEVPTLLPAFQGRGGGPSLSSRPIAATATAATGMAPWPEPLADTGFGAGILCGAALAPMVPDIESSVDEEILVSHTLWPVLKGLVEEVRAELLGHPSEESDTSTCVGTRLQRGQPEGTFRQADEAGKFLADGIEIYTSLLESLQSSRKQTVSDWTSVKSGFQRKINACLKDDSEAGEDIKCETGSHDQGSSKRSFRAKANPYRKKRAVLPKRATQQLKQWLFANVASPYPDDDEKDELILQTGLSVQQINNWFINARRRLLVSRASPASTSASAASDSA